MLYDAAGAAGAGYAGAAGAVLAGAAGAAYELSMLWFGRNYFHGSTYLRLFKYRITQMW